MVTVESIKPITGAGNLRAFAIVNIADRLRVHDVRIIQQPNQEAWVSMPSRAYEKDGQRKWAPTLEILDDNLKAEISRAVLTEYKKGASTSAAGRNGALAMSFKPEFEYLEDTRLIFAKCATAAAVGGSTLPAKCQKPGCGGVVEKV